MKRVIFLVLVLFVGLGTMAVGQTVKFSFCKSYCGKQWKLTATEEFGVEGDPEENMQKDEAFFGEDGKVKITLFGKMIEGKWTIDNTQTYITVSNEKTKEKTFLKVIQTDNPAEMTLEFKDTNLVKTKMIYEKK
ncbi:MAG: hypothetical protein ACJ75J_00360 [Cytophagaceae bacterium]